MSDERKDRDWSFTEILSFFRLVQGVISYFIFGIGVIVLGEMYYAMNGQPRPGWLSTLESVYGSMWSGTQNATQWFFEGHPSATDCAVTFVQFNDGQEIARMTFDSRNLSDLSQQVSGNGGVWQKVQMTTGPKKGAQGWVIRADFLQKRAACGEQSSN
jgi:hypothetical protein